MSYHQRLTNMISDPTGSARVLWNDTGWRFTIIASALIFLLELFGDLADVDQPAVWWGAELLTIVVVARVLTRRPLRGTMSDVENMTPILASFGLIICEVVFSYTWVAPSFAAEPIFWPFTLILILTTVGARLLAPFATRPLVIWVLVFTFLQFWMNLTFSLTDIYYPAPALTWAVAMTVFAVVARWIAGKGLGGPIVSPLNVALVLFVLLDWWMEFGLHDSGVGNDWLSEDLYWPWILVNSGLAIGVALISPRVSEWLAQSTSE